LRANRPTNSFEGLSEAAHTGFTAESVEDPIWSDPKTCLESETPLACEFRHSKPGVVLIMFGTNDVTNLTAVQFDFFLRLIVHDSVTAGIIPLLSTFPGDPAHARKSMVLNQIVFDVARDYDVPVMNLWAAIQPLPGNGRQPASAYLTRPPNTSVASFTDASLKYGYTMRNLITLQALDILYQGVILDSAAK
ncbi:MAG TPA: SGNH/GDSL hydrolase family protein, partial [Aggregatilineales bacterium]|nr:SGNH/GDSL hydrolase family protein [Aggregatilineales bacterium]